jgi:hypothetical protein
MGRELRRRRRVSGDRGTALVESAIVLPFLALMVFGIVELGFMFRSASVVTSSTRSGARLMSAQYGSAKPADQPTIISAVRQTVENDLINRAPVDTPKRLWIYKARADGLPISGNFTSCTSPCFTFTWTGSSFTMNAGGSWPTPVVCGVDHDSVGIFVEMDHAPVGFANFLGTMTLGEHTVMTLEAPNPNTCPGGT